MTDTPDAKGAENAEGAEEQKKGREPGTCHVPLLISSRSSSALSAPAAFISPVRRWYTGGIAAPG